MFHEPTPAEADVIHELLKLVCTAAITAGAGFFAAVGLRRVWYVDERNRKERHAKATLLAELIDFVRHYEQNLQVLEAIDTNVGMPSAMHFQMLHVPEYALVFDAETLKLIPATEAAAVNHLRLILRNCNLEADAMAWCVTGPNYHRKHLENHLPFAKNRTAAVLVKLKWCIGVLDPNAKVPELVKNDKTIVYDDWPKRTPGIQNTTVFFRNSGARRKPLSGP